MLCFAEYQLIFIINSTRRPRPTPRCALSTPDGCRRLSANQKQIFKSTATHSFFGQCFSDSFSLAVYHNDSDICLRHSVGFSNGQRDILFDVWQFNHQWLWGETCSQGQTSNVRLTKTNAATKASFNRGKLPENVSSSSRCRIFFISAEFSLMHTWDRSTYFVSNHSTWNASQEKLSYSLQFSIVCREKNIYVRIAGYRSRWIQDTR